MHLEAYLSHQMKSVNNVAGKVSSIVNISIKIKDN